MSHGCRDAVGSGVAAPENDNVLVRGGDVAAVGEPTVKKALRVGPQELHSKVDSIKVPSLNREIPGLRSSRAYHDRVKVLYEFVSVNILSHFRVGDELDSLLREYIDAAVDYLLV